MRFEPIKPDLVKYEMRMVQGIDPHVREQRKPGAFGRFLSGFGKVMGAVAFPLSFLFPPAAIGAAAMYGTGAIGDQVQQRTYAKQLEKAQRDQATMVSFPGLEPDAGGPQGPQLANGRSLADEQVMNVLFSRGEAVSEHAHSI